MSKRLVLVDFENVQKLDLSILDESYRAIVFVGASQAPPKAARNKATAHRFSRVDFQKIEGNGKNALDFHIAFHLGRTFETAPETECIVLSKDKGYDPLLVHPNKNGLSCRRIVSLEELLPDVLVAAVEGPGQVVCRRCGKSSTIEPPWGAVVHELRFVRQSAGSDATAFAAGGVSGEPARTVCRAAGAGARAISVAGVRLVSSKGRHGRRDLRRRGVDVRRLHCAIRT